MKSLPCAQLRQPQSLQSDMRVQDNFFCFFSVRKRGHVFRSAQQPTSNCETQKTKKGPSAILVLLLENLPTPHCPTNSPCQSCSSYAASRPPRRSSEKRTTPKTPAWLAWSSARPKRLLPVVASEPTPKPTTPQARRKGKKGNQASPRAPDAPAAHSHYCNNTKYFTSPTMIVHLSIYYVLQNTFIIKY